MMKPKNKIKINDNVIYSDEIPTSVKNLFYLFYTSRFADLKRATTNYRFTKALLYNRIPKNENDFNDNTFIEDCKVFVKGTKYVDHTVIPMLKRFYSFLLEEGFGTFAILTPKIVNSNSIIQDMQNEFKLIQRDTYLSPPFEHEKWLLIENGQLYKFDFTKCNDPTIANFYKEYIWVEPRPSTKTKLSKFGNMIDFLNTLKPSSPLTVTVHNIIQHKQYLMKSVSSQSAFVIMSNIKDFLKYLDSTGQLCTEGMVFELCKMYNTNSKGSTTSYTQDDMETIVKKMSERYASESDNYLRVLYHVQIIFLLYLLNTPIRAESLFNLKVSDLNRIGPNSWQYVTETKTKEFETIEITREIKALHDELINITKEFRNTDSTIGEYLFIYCRPRGKVIDRISLVNLNKTINSICEKNNITPLGLAGIRNRYMQNITKIASQRSNPSTLIASVSKHSLNVHYKNYFDVDIDRICVERFGISIADQDIKGIVAPYNPDAKKENEVMNGRGNCGCESCDDKTMLDCLMCKNFVTTPTNIPFFINEIEKLDKRLLCTELAEEKEFLLSKKRLNVAYLAAANLLLTKGGKKDDH
ncbi:MAG: hypothetical protein E7192_01745 [Erysipelotrichaceae bacterium]|nr:hypothetical protein [Erysipelotrichaceae bacterium]